MDQEGCVSRGNGSSIILVRDHLARLYVSVCLLSCVGELQLWSWVPVPVSEMRKWGKDKHHIS